MDLMNELLNECTVHVYHGACTHKQLLHEKLQTISELQSCPPIMSSHIGSLLPGLHKFGIHFFKVLLFLGKEKMGKIYLKLIISISVASFCLGSSQSPVVWKRGASSWHGNPEVGVNKWTLGVTLLKGCQPLLSCLFHINPHVQRKSECTGCWERYFHILNCTKITSGLSD